MLFTPGITLKTPGGLVQPINQVVVASSGTGTLPIPIVDTIQNTLQYGICYISITCAAGPGSEYKLTIIQGDGSAALYTNLGIAQSSAISSAGQLFMLGPCSLWTWNLDNTYPTSSDLTVLFTIIQYI